MLYPSKRVAASMHFTLTRPFRTATTTNWITFYAGTRPTNEQLSAISTLDDQLLLDNKVGVLESNAGATWSWSSTTDENPLHFLNAFPTVKTFTSTGTGTITYAAVRCATFFIIVDVSGLNGGGIIQLDDTQAEPEKVITLQAIQHKIWG